MGRGAAADPGAEDPTRNVLDLVRAEARRQDDLRMAERELRRSELRRQDDLREVWAERLTEVASIRHHYEGDLRQAETARIDAIRGVDQAQVQRTADAQATTAGVLAAQVAAAAEAVRTSQQSMTQAQDAKMDAALAPMQKDIADLRRAQYEQAGQRAQVGESRLNLGAVFGGLSLVLVLVLGIIQIAAR